MSEAVEAHDANADRRRRTSVLDNLKRVARRRETIAYLVGSNLKAGHRDKLLGNLWNLLDPLLFLGVYFLVFGIGLRQAGDRPWDFVVFLSVGVLAFRFFDGVIAQAALCIRANRGIIHEVALPKAVFPIAVVFSRLYDFAWGLAVLLGVLLLSQFGLTPAVVWLPLVLLLQVALCVGLALLVAYLGAFYADTANVAAVVTRLLFFASPIFYHARGEAGSPGIIPERYLDLYYLNPLAGLLDGYRDALLWGRAPEAESLLYLAGVSSAVLIFGFALFSRGEGSFAKYI